MTDGFTPKLLDMSLDEIENLNVVDSTTITSHKKDTVNVVELKANLEKGKRRINIAINPYMKIKDKEYEIIPETTYDNNIWHKNYDEFEIK